MEDIQLPEASLESLKSGKTPSTFEFENTVKSMKIHNCDICNKSFKRKPHLVIHKRIHTKERPYNCKFCEKSFTQLASRNLHEKIHTEDKKFACNTCGKHFLHQLTLKKIMS